MSGHDVWILDQIVHDCKEHLGFERAIALEHWLPLSLYQIWVEKLLRRGTRAARTRRGSHPFTRTLLLDHEKANLGCVFGS
jgi:hypothetical protein